MKRIISVTVLLSCCLMSANKYKDTEFSFGAAGFLASAALQAGIAGLNYACPTPGKAAMLSAIDATYPVSMSALCGGAFFGSLFSTVPASRQQSEWRGLSPEAKKIKGISVWCYGAALGGLVGLASYAAAWYLNKI